MDEVIPLKKVLLLDFTDQACPNCPKAGIEVAGLKEIYGEELVVATIHASPRNLPLVTEEGNIYDAYFKTNLSGHPSGVIDGRLSPAYEQWGGVVLEQFNVFPSLEIDLSAVYDAATRKVAIVAQLKGIRSISNAKLLLWITENNVVDRQLLPTGVYDPAYTHQHIFRAAVNGTWGEEISINIEEEKELKSEYVLNEKWNSENISIICFVYNAASNEVYDVTEIYLKNN
jgi:hypothetical protein